MLITLLGAAPDTGNMGVTALCYSFLHAVQTILPAAQVCVQDHGRGMGPTSLDTPAGAYAYTRMGMVHSRRLYRPESLWQMTLRARCGGLGHAGLQWMRQSVVYDVSGGDSFADIYGEKRFEAMVMQKRLAGILRAPLILLPQTYGPFQHGKHRDIASRVIKQAQQSWARDAVGFEALRAMVGDAFDPKRHLAGMDLAFGLPMLDPGPALEPALRQMLACEVPCVGLNVSGLLYGHAQRHTNPFGLRMPYDEMILALGAHLLEKTDANLVLLPHVLGRDDVGVSDLRAAQMVRQALGPTHAGRVAVLDIGTDPRHTKWVISKLDWMAGARMHSVIAALSSGTPATGLAYSPKFAGVLAGCGQGAACVDLTTHDADAVCAACLAGYQARAETRACLEARLPAMRRQWQAQMEALLVPVVTADE